MAVTYQNVPARTGPSRGKKPAAVQGRNSRIYPKLKEIRAIKVNPSQFKQEQRKLAAVLTEKMPRNHPYPLAAGGEDKQSKADLEFPARGKDFWVPNQVLGQERRRNSKLSHQFFKAGAGGLEGGFRELQREEEDEQNRAGEKEEKGEKK
ncbi:hypothetical protein SLEP1_g55012 [Rubroshorea leprosula]|uniref:Uncharacterized protein n=1 Tax=Rubroshorea leprosula TaxID=152421 RepID=A0AAV5MEG3_9ROSI|nr:hypothetical protein SLEP1_g55012 [Rubroshorea leprosula]